MKYPWIDNYLRNKAGVHKDLQRDWNWIRYMVGGKMFCAICLDEQNLPYYITIKLKPERADVLRRMYLDILPGYYMNKSHWSSVKPDGQVPDKLIKDMLDEAYCLILHSLPRKKQKEILEEIS